ncbi:hypothetical protein CBM2634_P130011 [Cupriavidus taiwanensis]|uniref:Uncharacterized protein n=1 Tax=Cupriavidus taiwanensis TaxID=164546 RepID=A0A375JBL6_9BURK|nr:hypothetical protein CBM2634_P130011 [Cupriavidus taiwanensis]
MLAEPGANIVLNGFGDTKAVMSAIQATGAQVIHQPPICVNLKRSKSCLPWLTIPSVP